VVTSTRFDARRRKSLRKRAPSTFRNCLPTGRRRRRVAARLASPAVWRESEGPDFYPRQLWDFLSFIVNRSSRGRYGRPIPPPRVGAAMLSVRDLHRHHAQSVGEPRFCADRPPVVCPGVPRGDGRIREYVPGFASATQTRSHRSRRGSLS
jgi:hypothetical protein